MCDPELTLPSDTIRNYLMYKITAGLNDFSCLCREQIFHLSSYLYYLCIFNASGIELACLSGIASI